MNHRNSGKRRSPQSLIRRLLRFILRSDAGTAMIATNFLWRYNENIIREKTGGTAEWKYWIS